MATNVSATFPERDVVRCTYCLLRVSGKCILLLGYQYRANPHPPCSAEEHLVKPARVAATSIFVTLLLSLLDHSYKTFRSKSITLCLFTANANFLIPVQFLSLNRATSRRLLCLQVFKYSNQRPALDCSTSTMIFSFMLAQLSVDAV